MSLLLVKLRGCVPGQTQDSGVKSKAIVPRPEPRNQRWRTPPELNAMDETQKNEKTRVSPHAVREVCQTGARLSEAVGTRTRDLRIKSPLLYRLSYSPVGYSALMP